jgi:radical SAM superfamily enzyme YgiQ (UPF0313 family)
VFFTLISPRIAVQKGDFLGSGIPYWPVEMAVLAAFLRARGHDVRVIDLFGSNPRRLEDMGDHYLQGSSIESPLAALGPRPPDAAIVYALSYMSHSDVLAIARALKGAGHRRVCVLENSLAVTGYALPPLATAFFKSGVDALLCGEVYWNWEEIETFLRDSGGGSTPANVLSERSRADASVTRVYPEKPSYPVPAWDLFQPENYWRLPYAHGPGRVRYLPMLTSRGCPMACDFCVTPATNDRRWRARAPSEVVEEILDLRDWFGVRHFQVEDLNPCIDAARWEEICRLLVEREANVFFYFVSGTRAESIKLEQVPRLARAGCRYVSISPESGSPDVLAAMGKTFNYDHGIELVRACRRHGIVTQACFLAGHPAETDEDHRASCAYLRSLVRAGLDEVAVFGVSPLPGSALSSRGNVPVEAAGLRSFSPRERADWQTVARRRREMTSIFVREKLKRGLDLWRMAWRSLFGTPRTKLENLPRRILFIWRLIVGQRIRELGAAR